MPDQSSVKSSSPKRSPGAQSATTEVTQSSRASPNGKSKRSGSLVKDPREQQLQIPAQQSASSAQAQQKEPDARASGQQSQLTVDTQAKGPKASPSQSQAPLLSPQPPVAQASQSSQTSVSQTQNSAQSSIATISQPQQQALQQQLLQQQSLLQQMSPAHPAHQPLQSHGLSLSAGNLQTQAPQQQQQVTQQQQYAQLDLNGLLPPNNFGLATWADLLRLQQQQPQSFQTQQQHQQQQQNLFSGSFGTTSSGGGLGSSSMPHRSPNETFLPIDAARLQAPPAPSFMAQQYAQLASNNSLLNGMGGASQNQTQTPILDFSTLQPASNGNLTMANQADLAFWREMPIGCADLSDWDSFTNRWVL